MAQYQRRFGHHEIRIDVQYDDAVCTARLFLVNEHELSPVLDDQAQPVVLTAPTAAAAYRRAVHFLTVRFGPET